MKKFFSVILIAMIVAMYTVPSFSVAASEFTARSVNIFSVEGDNATMTKGPTSKEFLARNGMRLYEGYTVSTGKDTNVFLQLDNDSITRMDEQSKISVSKASKKLSLSVLSGAVAVDAAPQVDGNSLEIRAGSSVLAVRGTSFVVDYDSNGNLMFVMFTGRGQVDGNMLESGYIMQLNTNADKDYTAQPLTVNDGLSTFILQQIILRQDTLMELGIIDKADLDKAQDVLKERDYAKIEVAQGNIDSSLDNNVDVNNNSSSGNNTSGDSDAATEFILSYNLNGGTGITPSQVRGRAGDTVTIASAKQIIPINGMKFKEWNTNNRGTGRSYRPNSQFTFTGPNMTLYAIWQKDDIDDDRYAVFIGDRGFRSLGEAFSKAEYGDVVRITGTHKFSGKNEIRGNNGHGSLVIESNGRLIIDDDDRDVFIRTAGFSIEKGGKLVNKADLTISTSFVNDGIVENSGTLIFNSKTGLNRGTIDNRNDLIIDANSNFVFEEGSTLKNSDKIYIRNSKFTIPSNFTITPSNHKIGRAVVSIYINESEGITDFNGWFSNFTVNNGLIDNYKELYSLPLSNEYVRFVWDGNNWDAQVSLHNMLKLQEEIIEVENTQEAKEDEDEEIKENENNEQAIKDEDEEEEIKGNENNEEVINNENEEEEIKENENSEEVVNNEDENEEINENENNEEAVQGDEAAE